MRLSEDRWLILRASRVHNGWCQAHGIVEIFSESRAEQARIARLSKRESESEAMESEVKEEELPGLLGCPKKRARMVGLQCAYAECK